MQDGDIVKIDLLVEHSGNRKSKDAWSRIKKDFEELAQQTHNSKSIPCCPNCKTDVGVFHVCENCGHRWA